MRVELFDVLSDFGERRQISRNVAIFAPTWPSCGESCQFLQIQPNFAIMLLPEVVESMPISPILVQIAKFPRTWPNFGQYRRTMSSIGKYRVILQNPAKSCRMSRSLCQRGRIVRKIRRDNIQSRRMMSNRDGSRQKVENSVET